MPTYASMVSPLSHPKDKESLTIIIDMVEDLVFYQFIKCPGEISVTDFGLAKGIQAAKVIQDFAFGL